MRADEQRARRAGAAPAELAFHRNAPYAPTPDNRPVPLERGRLPRTRDRGWQMSGERAGRQARRAMLVLVAAMAIPLGIVRPPSAPDARSTLRSPRGLMSLPTGARGIVSLRLGADQPAYWLSGGRQPVAINRAQRLRATFSRSGISVQAGEGRFSLALRAAGYGGSLQAVSAAWPRAAANRLVYDHGSVQEWYGNGPLGLEQGFNIARPAARRAGAPFTLALQLGGDLLPSLARRGRGLLFRAADGHPVLRYGGLSATDSRGRRLPATLSLMGATASLRVDVRRARYPLSIDPFIQSAPLVASDGAPEDQLGYSVAVSGQTIVAGAPGHAAAGHAGQGAVYVFSAPASGAWTTGVQVARLTASDGAADDALGSSVAISGSTIVAGAPGSRAGRGAAYVFSAPASGRWQNATQTAELAASDGSTGDQFGASVAAAGVTIAVGAPEHSVVAQGGAGGAYVFTEPATGRWVNATQNAELIAADGAASDELGYAVAVSGSSVVASAPGHAVRGNAAQGAIYEFSAPASGGWRNAGQTAELTAADGAADDRLGDAVSVSGPVIAAGSALHAVGPNSAQGAVYVFSAPASGAWANATQSAELTASDGRAGDGLGSAVAASASVIAAGAPLRSVGGHDGQGAIYEFALPAAGRWATGTQSAVLTASSAATGDNLGHGVALEGGTLTAGAPFHGLFGGQDQGAAFVFSNGQNPPPPGPGKSPPPVLSRVRQSDRRWRPGNLLAGPARHVRRAAPVGTTFSFALNTPAQVTFSFSRVIGNRTRPTGSLHISGRVGINRLRFQGRLSRSRRLGTGRYTLTILAQTSGGRVSAPHRLAFTIVG